jgi:hypothetical protein
MKQINLYTFDELSANAQKKALEHLAEEFPFFDDHRTEAIEAFWKDRLEQLGFEDAEVYFSHSCSQGDGASFSCSNINMNTVINNLMLCERDFRKVCGLMSAHSLATGKRFPTEGRITPTLSRYSHEYSVSLEVDFPLGWYPPVEYKRVYWLRDVLERSIEQYRLALCHEIHKDVVAEYDYHNSFENLSELATANNTYFMENGEIYRGEVL